MTYQSRLGRLTLAFAFLCGLHMAHAANDQMQTGFANPPRQARVHCYWWWLNGNTDEAAITPDLEQMKAKGYGGALLCDANGSSQGGNRNVPAGPTFGSPAWRKLYRHALREAARLNLEISLNITSGWNLGGPAVTPNEASKILTFSRIVVRGPTNLHQSLATPTERNNFYRDIAVLAYPLHHGSALASAPHSQRRPIQRLPEKAAFKEFGWSVPVTTPLLQDFPSQAGEEDTLLNQVVNVTNRMTASGNFQRQVLAGDWEILRIGYTDSGAMVSTSSGARQGLAIDYLDHDALESYWHHTVDPLLADARSYIGKSLRYLVTDSWELGGTNPEFCSAQSGRPSQSAARLRL